MARSSKDPASRRRRCARSRRRTRMEFMQRMWNPLGVADARLRRRRRGRRRRACRRACRFRNPAAMFAALDPAEIDRKIAELRVIENWLTMSVNMMQMSIKTMELQKASLEAMRGSTPAIPTVTLKARHRCSSLTAAFANNGVIPGEFAFAVIDPATHVRLSDQPQPRFRVERHAAAHALARAPLPRPRRAVARGRRQQGRPHRAGHAAARRFLPLGADRHPAVGRIPSRGAPIPTA